MKKSIIHWSYLFSVVLLLLIGCDSKKEVYLDVYDKNGEPITQNLTVYINGDYVNYNPTPSGIEIQNLEVGSAVITVELEYEKEYRYVLIKELNGVFRSKVNFNLVNRSDDADLDDISILLEGAEDFGAVTIGQSPSQTFTIRNNSNRPVTIYEIEITPREFELLNSVNQINIKPNDEFSFEVGFTPRGEQTYNGTINLYNRADKEVLSKSIYGEGKNEIVYRPVAKISVDNYKLSNTINFGDVNVTTWETKKIEIGNSGNSKLKMKFELESQSYIFSISNNREVNVELAPNQSKIIEIKFAPTLVTEYKDNLKISSNDNAYSNKKIQLLGGGIRPALDVSLEELFEGALSSYKIGNYEDAIKNFSTIISYENSYAGAYYQRGMSYYNLSRYNEAKSDFDKTISYITKISSSQRSKVACNSLYFSARSAMQIYYITQTDNAKIDARNRWQEFLDYGCQSMKVQRNEAIAKLEELRN